MDKDTIAIVVGVLGGALGLISFLVARKREAGADWQKKIDAAVKPFLDIPDTLAEMYAELQVLKKQVDVFWKGVSFSSAQALHSPHTKELDRLLEKFQRDEIQSEKELHTLKDMLSDVARDDVNPMRRKLALDILSLIHIRFEIGGDVVEAFRKGTEM